MPIYPVILCGGSGTRLWPASRPSRPKQFIPLTGERSLFQETVLRLAGIEDARPPVVVAGAGHRAAIERQLSELGIKGVVMIEPEGRDSAPAIAAAAAWIAGREPDALAVVVASDHHIPDAAAFCAAVAVAARAAAKGRIVTFGVRPSGPATAYGYIQSGEAVEESPGVSPVARFVEKPDAATARAYVAAGHLWNSGNFVFAVSALMDELDRHAPEVARAARAALAEADQTGGVVVLGPSFRTAPKISIDYALMEKTDRAAVSPVDFTWSDLGAWDAVWAASPRDADGSVLSGPAEMIDSRDCLIRNPGGPMVVAVGLERIAVVVEPDAILVCSLDAAQGVKAATERLKGQGHAAADIVVAASLTAWRDRLTLWLTGAALPVWWALGADPAGGFHEALDHLARPVDAPRRARVQARQVYSYATAGALGWSGPWRVAVEHGLDNFLARYRRPDGLFRTLVDAGGHPLEETATLYDQAFALLALASGAGALPARAGSLEADALALVGALRRTRAGARGFTETIGPTPYQSNPHMHLLEAALAWEAVAPAGIWTGLADEIADLALSRLIDPVTGALREHFDADWAPAPGPEGRLIEPGHQFEWAWLLERWGAARGNADARAAAQRLYAAGSRGIDRRRGVAIDALSDDLSVLKPTARLWPQTEWLKAALILGRTGDATAAAAGLQHYLDGAGPGLWRDKLGPEGGFIAEPSPASSLYHIVCAISELAARA